MQGGIKWMDCLLSALPIAYQCVKRLWFPEELLKASTGNKHVSCALKNIETDSLKNPQPHRLRLYTEIRVNILEWLSLLPCRIHDLKEILI